MPTFSHDDLLREHLQDIDSIAIWLKDAYESRNAEEIAQASEKVMEIHGDRLNITYFDDTDTLLIELAGTIVDDTRDLYTNTLGEYDDNGKLVAVTLEHVSEQVEQTPILLVN
jgi:uncharacterized protein YuzE